MRPVNKIIPVEKLKQICMEFHKRISQLESTKIDIEYEVARKDHEVRGDIRYIYKNSWNEKFLLPEYNQ